MDQGALYKIIEYFLQHICGSILLSEANVFNLTLHLTRLLQEPSGTKQSNLQQSQLILLHGSINHIEKSHPPLTKNIIYIQDLTIHGQQAATH